VSEVAAGGEDALISEPAGLALPDAGRIGLEDERDFYLRSLRDLEAEWEAGDIDPADYRELKDSYTSRAAAVLRQLSGEESAIESLVNDDALVGDGAGIGDGLAGDGLAGDGLAGDGLAGDGLAGDGLAGDGQAGEELVDDTSGDTNSDGDAGQGERRGDSVAPELDWRRGSRRGARRASRDQPVQRRNRWIRRVLIGVGIAVIAAGVAWSVAASSGTRLPGEQITGQALGPEAEARSLQSAQQAADKGDDVTALKDYQKVLAAYPDQPEALTGEGWILAQTQQPSLLKQGLTMLVSAENADPSYAPAHLYRGVALLSEDDYADAIPELRWYLDHNPDPQLTANVRSALQNAEAKQAQASKAKPGG
jgi:hypothetical protein